MAGNWFSNGISSLGSAFNAPVLFDWDTDAARADYVSDTKNKYLAGGDTKRSSSSAAAQAWESDHPTVERMPVYANSAIPGAISPAPSGVLGGYGGGAGGGGGASAAPRPDAEAVAYWNDNIGSLQRLLDSTNTQRGQGVENINNSFNRNLDSINGQESRTLRDYGIKEQDTQAARQDNLQRISGQARQGNEGLQRLFQLSGAGVSSASQMVAPNAVARDASGKRASTLNTFGKNMRDIDTARTDAKEQFASSRTDLESQKRQKEQSFIEGILNLQNDLNSKLSNAVTQRGIAQGGTYSGLAGARAQYDGAIRDNQSKIDGLFNQYKDPAFNVRAVNARVPNLAQYTADPTAIDLAQQNPGIPEELLPYLPGLKDKENGLF